METKKDDIAVLIPAYNEEQTILKVINDFETKLPYAKIYVYDNNSTDKTQQIVLEKQKFNTNIIYKKEIIQGKGAVIRSMFRDINARVYIMIDADDTYPVEYCLDLIRGINSGADMVIGDRLTKGEYYKENKRAFHNFGNNLIRNLINFIFKSNVKDILTGYRAFSYNFVKSFPAQSQKFQVEAEMTIHALDKNLKIISIPVSYRDRPLGSDSKLNTVSDGLKALLTVFNLFKNNRPLLFFTVISAILFVVGAIPFIGVLRDFVKTNTVLKFPTLIVSCFVILISIVVFCSGLIMDLIKNKHKEQVEILIKK